MKKICLSIDQMRQLKELGVETKNASMCWVHLINYNNSLNASTDEHILSFNKPELYLAIEVHKKADDQGSKEFIKDVIPAFTLQDMFDIMPKKLKLKVDRNLIPLDCELRADITNELIYYEHISYEDHNYVQVFSENNLMECAYEVLCWLAENNYMKGDQVCI